MTYSDPIKNGLRRAVPFAAHARSAYSVEIAGSFAAVAKLWSTMIAGGDALCFHDVKWLEVWEQTFGREPGVDVLAATVYDAQGAPVMALPLVRRRMGLRHHIMFADAGVVDYNAPILSPAAPSDRVGALQMWRALCAALPRADVIRLDRMPHVVGTRPNPLAQLIGTRPASTPGLTLDMPGTFAEWRSGLPRRYRMELGRCGRLFDALPGARMVHVDNRDERILAALETLQRQRIHDLGLPYLLDGKTFRAFYRRVARECVGSAHLTALSTDRDIVAVMLGLRDGKRFTMLRIGAAGGAYARLSPARHLIVRTIEMLRSEGVETFDFGLGDYTYKRKLGGREVALCDLVAAGSPLGLPDVAAFRIKAQLKKNERLRQIAERFGSRGTSRTDQSS